MRLGKNGLALVAAVVLAGTGLSAQSLFSKGDLLLHIRPMGFLDIDAGLNLGLNYRYSNSSSFSVIPGIILYNPYLSREWENRGNPFGFKVKADWRRHFKGDFLWFSRFYMAIDLHYKYTKTLREGTVGYNCLQGNCDYYQLLTYTEKKWEYGMALKGGIEIPLSRTDHRWSLEWYGGYGFKFLVFKEKGLASSASFPNGTEHLLLPWEADEAAGPYLPGGLSIVYKIY